MMYFVQIDISVVFSVFNDNEKYKANMLSDFQISLDQRFLGEFYNIAYVTTLNTLFVIFILIALKMMCFTLKIQHQPLFMIHLQCSNPLVNLHMR